MTLGERVKQRRIELGLTQIELAHRMGYKNKSAICNIETRDDNLTTDRISKLAVALETTASYLMGWDDELDYYSLNKEDEKFLNLIHSLELTEEQKQQVLTYAKAIKHIEEQEKRK